MNELEQIYLDRLKIKFEVLKIHYSNMSTKIERLVVAIDQFKEIPEFDKFPLFDEDVKQFIHGIKLEPETEREKLLDYLIQVLEAGIDQ